MNWKIWIAFFRARPLGLRPNPLRLASKRPFTFEDMMSLKRVGEPVPSPDGKWVVFAAVDVDLQANTKISHLWIVPAAGGDRTPFESNNEPRRAPPVFAGRHQTDLDVEGDRSDANLDVELHPGQRRIGRNAASGDEHFDRGRRRDLVA